MEGDISVEGTDGGDGGAPALKASDTFHVTVMNVAPTITFASANPTTIDEGSSSATEYTYRYTITEPGDDTVTVSGISCGGGALVPGSAANTKTEGSFKCTFDASDGPVAHNVSAVATDSDGASGASARQDVRIANALPVVKWILPLNYTSYMRYQAVTFSFSFTDAGANDGPWSCRFDWGDGTSTIVSPSSAKTCTFARSFATSGLRRVTASVTDKDGGVGTAMRIINVY
jgi:hypothetical protein